MAKKSGFKYPRLTILSLVLLVTIFVFSKESSLISSIVDSFGFAGTFVAGFLYAFSFTAFAATGILFAMGGFENIFAAGIIAGLGSVVGDLIILKLAKISFEKEFKYLFQEKFFKSLTKPIPRPIQHFLKVVIAMIIIASPFPDEAGVTLLANGYQIPKPLFIAISFILNTTGILTILYAGKLL